MIYCFDLDDTLFDRKERPLMKRIAVVNKLYDDGNTIIIDTARGSVTGKDHYQEVKNLLTRHRVKYHKLRTGVKIFCNTYVGDEAINSNDFFK